MKQYILKDKTPIPCDDMREFAIWYANDKNRILRQDYLDEKVLVSTVFLGFDHAFGGVPILFETMIFELPELEDYQRRYHTWDEAQEGHKVALELAKKALKDSTDGRN